MSEISHVPVAKNYDHLLLGNLIKVKVKVLGLYESGNFLSMKTLDSFEPTQKPEIGKPYVGNVVYISPPPSG